MSVDLQKIMIHRPPMLLVDELVSCSTDDALATVTFQESDLVMNGDVVSEAALIESMAQTVAAQHGSLAVDSGDGPRSGVLVGVQDVSFHALAKAGQTLRISTHILHRLGGLFMAECRVTIDETLIAQGKLKFHEVGASE